MIVIIKNRAVRGFEIPASKGVETTPTIISLRLHVALLVTQAIGCLGTNFTTIVFMDSIK